MRCGISRSRIGTIAFRDNKKGQHLKYIDYLRKHSWLIISVCVLTGLFYVFDYFIQVAPSVITNQLMKTWNLDAGSLGLVLSAFFLSYLILQIPAGMIFAKYGVRWVFSLAVLVSSAGVFIFTGASDAWLAGLGQLFIGAGSAFAFLGTLNLSAQWLSHRYFAMIAGIVQFAGVLGAIYAQEPMSHFVQHYSWQDILFVAAIICLAMAVVFWLIIRDNDQYLPNKSPDTRELPILKKVLKNPQAWCAYIISFCGWSAVGGFASLWGPSYLVKVQHITTSEAGSYLTWFWLAIGIGSPIFGYITAHIKDIRWPIVVSFFLGMIGFVAVMLLHGQPGWWLDCCLLLLGLGSVAQAMSFGALKNCVKPASFATATGVNNLMAILAGAVFKLSASFFLDVMNPHAGHEANTYSMHSYLIAFSPVGLALLVGFITALFFLDGKKGVVHAPDSD
jgi:sugar phosphate permease